MVKRTDTRTSHGNECMGDYVTGERCKRSRARTGKPVVLSKKCEKCKEQRCKAIENAWDILRKRLAVSQPTHLEDRASFVKRLERAVLWMNTHRSAQLWKLSTNQKKRASECLSAKPPGGRTQW